MGKYPTIPLHILNTIEAVGPVSINNVYNFVSSGDYKNRIITLKKSADSLVNKNLASPVIIDELYPKRFTTTYATKPTERNSNRQYPHDSAVKDIAVAFYWIFYAKRKFFDIEFNYNVKFKLKDGYYSPDLLITLQKEEDGETYNFIIEMECSRKPGEIYREKIIKNLELLKTKMIPLQRVGGNPLGEPLDKRTKFLYFITTQKYNRYTFARPHVTQREAEYFKGNYDYVRFSEERKKSEDKAAQDLARLTNHPNFLFLPFHQFTQLDKPVFLQKNGSLVVRRHLINNL